MPLSRRQFLVGSAAAGTGLFLVSFAGGTRIVRAVPIPGASLDPEDITKFVTPLLIPPVMPRARTIPQRGGKPIDYYEISMRQLSQQILPTGLPADDGLGLRRGHERSDRGLLLHNAPSLTIEARVEPAGPGQVDQRARGRGRELPAASSPGRPNAPLGEPARWHDRSRQPSEFRRRPDRYTGPVPMVTHVHGAVGVGDESDGYAEAWYLPAAGNIPAGYATEGTWYDFFAGKAQTRFGVDWGPGYATFQYPNANRASTIWYHDHTLGMTRLNVYAGPAGFYIVRGGPDDTVLDTRDSSMAVLPGPAPKANDKFPPNKTYYEIPIAIQDRAFNVDGSLFYPDTRAFFDGLVAPYIPEGGMEGFSPIWNPEYFGNTIMVNGNTWPFQVVEQRRYRFRFLNGCQSRFLILDFNEIPGVEVWQIGNEGGFLAAPVNMTADHENRILMGLAERADVIVDFTNVPLGRHVLANVGPDEPFGGGVPGSDFEIADPETTGQVMEFRVVPAVAADPTTPPQFLGLPAITPLPAAVRTRPLGLIEKAGTGEDHEGEEVEGPIEAVLGTIEAGLPVEHLWMDPVTENPGVGDTEIWELYNATADAHPMHVHEVTFEVVDREGLVMDDESRSCRSGRTAASPDPSRGKPGSRTRSSPIRVRSPASRRRSRHPASTSGIATSSSTRTTR